MPDTEPDYAEPLLSALAHICAQLGEAQAVAVLAESVGKLAVTGEDFNYATYTLFLYCNHKLLARVFSKKEELEDSLLKKASNLFCRDDGYLRVVSIVPDLHVEPDWREQAKAYLRGEGVTNQGRVRSDNIAGKLHDGLLLSS